MLVAQTWAVTMEQLPFATAQAIGPLKYINIVYNLNIINKYNIIYNKPKYNIIYNIK